MSDKEVPLDIAQQAIAIAEMRREQHFMLERIGSIYNVMGTINSSVSNLNDKFGKMMELQAASDNNAQAVHNISTEFSDFRSELKSWQRDMEKNRDEWRTKHERENNQTEKKLERWGGGLAVTALLGGVVVSIFVYSLMQQVSFNDRDDARQDAMMVKNRDLIDAQNQELNELKLEIVRMKGNTNHKEQQP